MINEYPIFVISYKRAKTHKTSRKLAEFGVNHYLVVHKEQAEEYKNNFSEDMKKHTKILIFDDDYKLKYETCDNIPHCVQNAGSGAERNFAWDFAKNVLKTKAHWVMDDNMGFYYISGKASNGRSYIRKPCIDKAINILNWKPVTSLSNGLDNTINYFKGLKDD